MVRDQVVDFHKVIESYFHLLGKEFHPKTRTLGFNLKVSTTSPQGERKLTLVYRWNYYISQSNVSSTKSLMKLYLEWNTF